LANVLAKENEPLVRGHAAWAIGQIGGVEARLALEHARTQEKDIGVLKEIEAALKEIRAEG
jgi:epoxyqueuosine reductase